MCLLTQFLQHHCCSPCHQGYPVNLHKYLPKVNPIVSRPISQNARIFLCHCRPCHNCSSLQRRASGSGGACGTLQGTSPHSGLLIPSQEYEFSLRIVTPAGGTLLTMPGLLLPPLPDIEDYVPPPFTEVVKVRISKLDGFKFLHSISQMSVTGGKLTLTTQASSPVPASCLPRYMEVTKFYNLIFSTGCGCLCQPC